MLRKYVLVALIGASTFLIARPAAAEFLRFFWADNGFGGKVCIGVWQNADGTTQDKPANNSNCP